MQDHLLYLGDSHRGHPGDSFCGFHRFSHYFIVVNQTTDKPHRKSLRRINHFSGKAQLHRSELSHSAHKALRSACPGHYAHAHLWLTKLRTTSDNGDIAMHCQFHAPAQCKSIHCGDHRNRTVSNGCPKSFSVPVIHFDRRKS